MNSIKSFFDFIISQIKTISIVDIIDIVIVSVLIYYFYVFIKGRRAGKLAIGVILFFALLFISDITGMQVLYFLLKNFVQVGLIAIIIVFQPELRSMLEQVGEPIKNISKITQAPKATIESAIDNICEAAKEFSLSRTGALLVIERQTKLGDVIKTGTVIDAECTLFLIRNIFFNKAPLHDGAAIVRNGRLYAAGCFLPLSSQEIDLNLGTRHRAGLGMSENSDALVIIVSEETGNITIAQNGILKICNNIPELRTEMRNQLIHDTSDTAKRLTGKIFGQKTDREKAAMRRKKQNGNKNK